MASGGAVSDPIRPCSGVRFESTTTRSPSSVSRHEGFTGTEVGLPDRHLAADDDAEGGRPGPADQRLDELDRDDRAAEAWREPRAAGAELTAYLDSHEQATPARLPGGRAAAAHASAGRQRQLPCPARARPGAQGAASSSRRLRWCWHASMWRACSSCDPSRERKEIAVRLALGARRSHLVRQFLTETLVLAALGGTAGLLMAPWAVGLLVASQPYQLGIDASARHARLHVRPRRLDRHRARSSGWRRFSRRARSGLVQVSGITRRRRAGRAAAPTVHDVIVTCQIAVSLVMLIGAGLFVQSLQSLSSVDPGFRADDLLLISVDPGSAGYDGNRLRGFLARHARSRRASSVE